MARLLPERHLCLKAQGRQEEGGAEGESEGRRERIYSLKACRIHRRAEHQNKNSFERAKEMLDGC
jgi:hypothetical protein